MMNLIEKENDQVSPDVEHRFGFVHLHVADGAVFARFQVPHDAHFANCKTKKHNLKWKRSSWAERTSRPRGTLRFRKCLTGVEALDDGGGVDEVSSTQDADEVGVELRDLYPGGPVHDGRADDRPAASEFSVILSTVHNIIL